MITVNDSIISGNILFVPDKSFFLPKFKDGVENKIFLYYDISSKKIILSQMQLSDILRKTCYN